MKEPQRQLQQDTKQEVIKHSAAIQIENSMTLLQRRAWNALLFNAYNELDKKEEHQISLQYLAHLVGYDSHDMEYLKAASIAMLRCIVQYNVLGRACRVMEVGDTGQRFQPKEHQVLVLG